MLHDPQRLTLAYTRAHELAERRGDRQQMFAAVYLSAQGAFEEAVACSREGLASGVGAMLPIRVVRMTDIFLTGIRTHLCISSRREGRANHEDRRHRRHSPARNERRSTKSSPAI